MSTPTRFTHGVTNVPKTSNLGGLLGVAPDKMAQYFVDFSGLDYLTTAWTVTETQAGATQNLVASDAGGEYGLLALVNTAGATDLNSIQLTTAPLFITDTTKRWWLKGRVSRDNADEGMGFGVQAVNATPFTVANGIWVNILGTSTDAVFRIAKASTATTATVTGAYPTSALNTFVTLGMAYDGQNIECYVDDVLRARIEVLTNFPNTAALTPTISGLNTSANARTVHCDYFYFAVER